MDYPFSFDGPVTGKYFVGRRDDVQLLQNLLFSGESVAVYGEPGVGCKSLALQALSEGRLKLQQFIPAEVDLTRARTLEDVLVSFASGLIRACGTTVEEFRSIAAEALQGTHLVFDEERFSSCGEVVSPSWMLDEIDVEKVLALPSYVASRRHTRVVVMVKEFSSVLFAEDPDLVLKPLEKVIARQDRSCPFVFMGSAYGAMRYIFDKKRYFYHTVERLTPSPLRPEDISDYVLMALRNSGRVIERDLVERVAQMLRCNPRYVNHLFFIVDAIAKGFISQKSIEDALGVLLGVYSPSFFAKMADLTNFQVSLLRAICDGNEKLSASGVIDKYSLNSSANVKRLKDALEKKEVVWFDAEDIPHVTDPLFEHWLRKVYFAG